MKKSKSFGGVLLIVILIIAFIGAGILGFLTYRYFTPEKRKLRHYTKGFTAYKQAKYAVAIKELESALAIDNKDLQLRYLLASAHFLYSEQDKMELEKALEELNKIIAIDETYHQAHNLCSDVYMNMAFVLIVPNKEDKEAYQEYLKTRQEYFKQAISHCDKLIALHPKDVEYWNKRGRVLLQMEEPEKAKADFLKAMEISPKDARAYINICMIYWNEKKADLVCGLLEKYLKELDPKNIDVIVQIGEYYIELRKFDLSLQHFQNANNIAPDSYDKVLPGLSLAFLSTGDIEKASLTAQKGLSKISTEKEERYMRPKVIMTYVLGSTQLVKREFEAACKNLLWVYDKAPYFADTLYKLALAYQASGKNGLAIEKLQEGIKLNPNALALRGLLIEILSQEGQWEKAEEECNKLIKENSNELSGWRLKARIFLAQGKDDKARECYQEINKIAPESTEGKIGLAVVELSKNRFQPALDILIKTNEIQPKDPAVHFLMSQAYVGLNNLESGLNEINDTLKLDPNFTAARILLARIRMFQNSIPLAIQEYENLYKAYPDNIRILLELGQLYMRQGQPDKAIELIQKNRNVDLNDPIFLESLSRIYFAKRDYDTALKYAEKIKDPNALQKMLLGDIYYALGKYDEAIQAFKKSNLLDEKAMMHGPMAISFYMKKMWPEAIEELRLHLRQSPKADLLRIFRAMLLIFEKNYEEAIEESKYVVKEENQFRWLGRVIRAGMFIEMGQFEQAEEEIKDIPENFPYLQDLQEIIAICRKDTNSNIRPLMEALILQELARREEALEKCEETLKIFPNQPIIQFIKSTILLNLGKFDDARVILEKLIELPKAPLYMYNALAGLYIQTQKYAEAEKCYQKALIVRPDSQDFMLALAMLYETQKATEKAIKQYQKILAATEAKKEENANIRTITLNNLAWLYLEDNKKPQNRKIALKYAKASFEASQYSWAIADTLGWAYYYNDDEKDNMQLALRYLNYAKNLKPDYPGIHYHLGKVYLKLNKIQEAKEAFQNALKVSKDFKEAKETEELLKQLEKK